MLSYFKCLFITFIFLIFIKSFGGVTNPDISAIGQVIGKYTDDGASGFTKKPTLELGEAELMLDASLNPYVNGAFVFSLDQDAFAIEEAYASVIRGLPWNLGLKAGKYRLGFGRLNPAHPHAYPFISTPRIMDPGVAKLLPGSESFNDIAVQASSLIPIGDNYSLLVSGDILQGNSFHPDTTLHTADFGWLARIDNSFLIGENAPISVGFSFTRGTSSPAENTKDFIIGTDVKTKLTLSPTIVMTLQDEYIYKFAIMPIHSALFLRIIGEGFTVLSTPIFKTTTTPGFFTNSTNHPIPVLSTEGLNPLSALTFLKKARHFDWPMSISFHIKVQQKTP